MSTFLRSVFSSLCLSSFGSRCGLELNASSWGTIEDSQHLARVELEDNHQSGALRGEAGLPSRGSTWSRGTGMGCGGDTVVESLGVHIPTCYIKNKNEDRYSPDVDGGVLITLKPNFPGYYCI